MIIGCHAWQRARPFALRLLAQVTGLGALEKIATFGDALDFVAQHQKDLTVQGGAFGAVQRRGGGDRRVHEVKDNGLTCRYVVIFLVQHERTASGAVRRRDNLMPPTP